MNGMKYNNNLHNQLHWTMRITAALCFVGHGAWGIITKEAWLPFFASQGISEQVAWHLMPIIGLVDIGMALLLLIKHLRIVLVWMLIWSLWTAILRPISGTPGMWEFFERAGNFAPPFILLLMSGNFYIKFKDWFSTYKEPLLHNDKIELIYFICKLAIGLLLIGHGGFGAFVQKPMLVEHLASVGLPSSIDLVITLGYFEIALGIITLIKPTKPLLWFILIWKISTEFLYITDGGIINIFEFIERCGDYGLPLALIMIIGYQKQVSGKHT